MWARMLGAIGITIAMGCDVLPVDPGCRCEGAVPEGRLAVACGLTQCVGGTEYECTGENAAVARGACGALDAALPDTDGGMGLDAGDAGAERDAGRLATDDAGACTERTFYLDMDHDGFGDAAMSREACDAPAGYVLDDGDCVDGDAAIHPDADELCDGADNDCDGAASACEGSEGAYAGTYRIVTTERLGSSIINQMTCTGTITIAVAHDAAPVLDGDGACTYSGGLSAFDGSQSATFAGDLMPDGTLSGRVTHRFDSGLERTFDFTGAWGASAITIEGTGSWRPHPSSAVPWEVELEASAAR